jgi:multiple sugar transport system permease protein
MAVATPTASAERQVSRPPWRVRHREARTALMFISPWLLGFLVFTAWPMIYSAYLSLTDYDVINSPSFVGLDNYREMLQDPKVYLALRNTFWFVVVQVPLHVLAALALAMLLAKAGRTSGFFRVVAYLPKMTPPVAAGVLLLMLLNGQGGLVNEVLSWFGVQGPAWTTDPHWVKPGLVMLSLWTVGSSAIILLAALRAVPAELYDSARVDGAGWWHQTRYVTLPMISPAVFFVTLVSTIAAFQAFTEAYTAFFGSGNTTYSNDAALFYAIYLFQQAFQFLHMGYASALAWLLFVIIAVFSAVQVLVSRRLVHYEAGD